METYENENTTAPKSLGCIKSCSKREVYKIPAYFKKQEKSQNNITPIGARKNKKKQNPNPTEGRK